MTSTSLISVAAMAFLTFWAVGAYNRLVRLKNTIANAFGQIDLQLKHRYDLIPKLVEAASTYLSQEHDALEAVTKARHQAKAAGEAARGRPANALAMTTLAVAEQALTSSLRDLLALKEAYPEFKADQTIRDLSEELTRTENKVTFARQAFNDAVLDYNNAQGQFPTVLVARVFSFAPSAMLQVSTGADQPKAVRIQG